MQKSSADSIYNKHLKALPVEQQLEIIEVIAEKVSDSLRKLQPSTKNILDLEGVGADLWNTVDAQTYVNTLRNEWNNRP